MKKGNLVSAAVCAILGIAVILIALGYPKAEAYGTGVPGPGLWPICISTVLLLCSAVLVFKTLRIKKKEEASLNLWTAGSRRVYISMALLTVYVAVLQYVGFLLSTTIMVFIFVQWFTRKKWYRSLLISVACTLAIYFVFKMLLNVPMDFGFFTL